MHTAAVHRCLHQSPDGFDVVVVAPRGDGQEETYPPLRDIGRVDYGAPGFTASGERSAAEVLRVYLSRTLACVLLADLPREGTPDLFVSGTHFIPDVFPALAKSFGARKSKRAAYVFHLIRDAERASSLRTWLAEKQEALCLAALRRWFEKIVVINEQTRSRLVELGFDRERIFLTRCPVDVPEVSPRSLGAKDVSVAFCGRLVAQKGVFDFLAVCERLQREDPSFSAVMIGPGPEKAALEKAIREKGLRVRLTGFVSDEEKVDLLARAKLFVFPSYEEGWGIVISEALALGTPVLAYALDIYREIFGPLVHTSPIGDAGALADAASALLRRYREDPTAYVRDQERGLAFAESLSPSRVAEGELAFFRAD